MEPTVAACAWLAARRGSRRGNCSGSHKTATPTAGAPMNWLPQSCARTLSAAPCSETHPILSPPCQKLHSLDTQAKAGAASIVQDELLMYDIIIEDVLDFHQVGSTTCTRHESIDQDQMLWSRRHAIACRTSISRDPLNSQNLKYSFIIPP